MDKYYIDKKSDKLLLFFAGWGCDEYEFEHLYTDSDLLILYNYTDLKLDFNFSKYKEINLLAFSAGVFIASIFDYKFNINKKYAIDGNPYLFDTKYGLSDKMQDILFNITEDNVDDFARNFLVKTDEEYNNFHPSKRTIESCKTELICLKNLYKLNKQKIGDIFDKAIFGEDDKIFDVSAQKEFYGNKQRILKNSRHNPFFRIKSFEEIFYL